MTGTPRRVAILGGGLGGLAAAIRLAVAGCRVDLFEASNSVGGKAQEIRLGDFRFDTGPSLLTMLFVLDELFAVAGVRREDRLAAVPLPVLTRYFWSDGSRIDALADSTRFGRELHERFGESPDALARFLKRASDIYDVSAEAFLLHPIGSARGLLSLLHPKRLGKLHRLDIRRTMHESISSHFRDPRVIQLFDRYATYNGSDPFRAPATLNIIAHVETTLGAWVLRGGMRALPVELERLAREVGVAIHLGAKATRIESSGGRITGLVVNGAGAPFDAVVSNADVAATFRMVGLEEGARRQEAHEPSSSALVWFAALRTSLPSLDVHNILFARDYRAEFRDLFGERRLHEDPTTYLYLSRRFRPEDAPAGGENLFAMINVPADDGRDWKEEGRRARDAMLRKIRATLGVDLEAHVEAEALLTPRDILERTGSAKGSIYGISSNDKKAAFLRQPNRVRALRGLYFCGGGAHPGGGIPLVLLSGKIASEALLRDFPRRNG